MQKRRESSGEINREDGSRVMREQLLLQPLTFCLRCIREHLSTFNTLLEECDSHLREPIHWVAETAERIFAPVLDMESGRAHAASRILFPA
eukprot:9013964-Pyramimonas_sp.AAC.1